MPYLAETHFGTRIIYYRVNFFWRYAKDPDKYAMYDVDGRYTDLDRALQVRDAICDVLSQVILPYSETQRLEALKKGIKDSELRWEKKGIKTSDLEWVRLHPMGTYLGFGDVQWSSCFRGYDGEGKCGWSVAVEPLIFGERPGMEIGWDEWQYWGVKNFRKMGLPIPSPDEGYWSSKASYYVSDTGSEEECPSPAGDSGI
ncbi:hypothetical protein M011DRAFT_475832 [Sporormia fimetaria CBS 119925]|uniref:Uncharacterized protein n=1 Tax=Sporormia fimetaria CBS 119925 TaxID=1340428 RepID=A0A6A6VFT0_9PLEO|nr:hypothetical protein M011DRAFT_475832 [Sporormia fimetaria CBS 119925]